MKIYSIGVFFIMALLTPLYGFGFQKVAAADSNEVTRLNKEAYAIRRSNADKTIALATTALNMAQNTRPVFLSGVAEAYRVIGIGYSYKFDQVKAFDNYLKALQSYKTLQNELGIARVNNNIGNLYRDNDFKTALEYFLTALPVAEKIKDIALIASINLNIANVYLRQQKYQDALNKYAQCREAFLKIGDLPNVVSCDQNSGVAYFNLRKYDKAEEALLQANAGAKDLPDMDAAIAGIDMTLADLYIAKGDFDKAQQYIAEGSRKDPTQKIQTDYLYTQYQLETRKKNYAKALDILKTIYSADSTDFSRRSTDQIAILQKKQEQDSQLKIQQRIISHSKNNLNLFMGAIIVVGLSVVIILLLVANVKRKAETNKKLADLNAEVSRQKDNLNRINHHLEEIIDERTKDLQIKNKKLSEYSSYLSHQIRGPIATLKGLMNLEKEGLVDKKECINMMNKCVSEIDDKIIDMSDMLHDPDRAGF